MTKKTGAAREARREKDRGFSTFSGKCTWYGPQDGIQKILWPYVMGRQTKDDIKKLAPKSTVSAKMT